MLQIERESSNTETEIFFHQRSGVGKGHGIHRVAVRQIDRRFRKRAECHIQCKQRRLVSTRTRVRIPNVMGF